MLSTTGRVIITLLVASTACHGVIFKPQNEFQALSSANSSLTVDLGSLFNNRAFGLKPNESSFDGQGSENHPSWKGQIYLPNLI